MIKKSQSIFDNLLRIMPELKNNVKFNKDYIDPLAARSLFNIWRTGQKDGDKYNRPNTLSYHDIERIKKEGLAVPIGDKIEITNKGAEVIRVMILGDNRSVFEDDETEIDYNTSLANTRNVKIAKKNKIAQNNWWDRFNIEESK